MPSTNGQFGNKRETRARHTAGASPKAIARALGVRPAVVIPIVRRAAREREAAKSQAVTNSRSRLKARTHPSGAASGAVPDHFADLHLVLQAVMGWQNDHRYDFAVDKRRIGEPSRDGDDWREDASRVHLRDVGACKGARLTYPYDFGDDWQHELVVENTVAPTPNPNAVCIAGERACPSEDCGTSGATLNS